MKLERVINEKPPKVVDSAVTITKAGEFRFNRSATVQIIKEHKTLKFFKDLENPDSWYFALSDTGDVNVRLQKKSVVCSARGIANQIKNSNNYEESDSISGKIGNKITDLELDVYPIFIKKAPRKI